MKKRAQCTVGEFTSDNDVDELLKELNDATKQRSDIWIGIDKSGLTAGEPITTSKNHVLIVEREGTFADSERGHTVIRLGKLQRDDVIVEWISSEGPVDVFEFTGPVTVTARRVGGNSRKSNRGISCEGDNLVTVTLNRTPAN